MLLDYIINFSLLFTFVIFFYFVYQHLAEYHDAYIDLHPWAVGVTTAIIGLLLMKTSIHVSNDVIGDIRNVVILIAGLIGGPISIFLSSLLIGIFRIYILGVTEVSIIAGLNTMFMGVILSIFASWKPITFRNMHYYLAYTIIQLGFGIVVLTTNMDNRLLGISSLFLSSIPALYTTVFVLNLFKKQFEQMNTIKKLAETDYLTNLPNIRKFKSILDESIENHHNFTLLLIDIDHFRDVNTTYGHIAGDEILKQVGQCLKQFAEEHEDAYTARVSGEEFYIVCKYAAPAFGLHYAYEMSKCISQSPFTIPDGQKVSITVSIGVANYPDNGKNIPELITATNQALQQAMSKGTSQIVHFNNI